ncbi:DUF5947 family protein [Actinoplanes sp. DH11]|uniref:DUF5947 family protein n=1 Tax=Actinoplanes sp. DH11 TaxID=2857011 RepID=UPI001E5B3F5E|nr:DUF5947 family protein [Actinoplanes sp. DH11]
MTSKVRQSAPAARPAPSPAGPRCALCSATIGARHRHLVDVREQSLVCGCPACHETRADDRFQPVPERYLEFPGEVLTEETWDDLRIPAGPAFLSMAADRLVACCPGPRGTTETALPATVWDRLVRRHPAFGTLRPGVEALLLRRSGGSFLVPIDACLELAGALRLSWRGYDGGAGAQHSLAMFFARVHARC